MSNLSITTNFQGPFTVGPTDKKPKPTGNDPVGLIMPSPNGTKEANSKVNPSDIKQANIEHLETAYNTVLSKIDNGEIPVPEGKTVEEFKNILEQAYKGNLNDIPQNATSVADFARSLYVNTYKEISPDVDIRQIAEDATRNTAALFPDSTIGGIRCSEITKHEQLMQKVIDSGNEALGKADDKANALNNREALDSAYNKMLSSLNTMNIDGVDMNNVKKQFAEIYNNIKENIVTIPVSEERYAYILASSLFKDPAVNPNSGGHNKNSYSALVTVADLYPDGDLAKQAREMGLKN